MNQRVISTSLPGSPRQYYNKNVVAISTQIVAGQRLNNSNTANNSQTTLPSFARRSQLDFTAASQFQVEGSQQESHVEAQPENDLARIVDLLNRQSLNNREKQFRFAYFRRQFPQIFIPIHDENWQTQCIQQLQYKEFENQEVLILFILQKIFKSSQAISMLTLAGLIQLTERFIKKSESSESRTLLKPFSAYVTSSNIELKAECQSSIVVIPVQFMKQFQRRLDYERKRATLQFMQTLPVLHYLDLEVYQKMVEQIHVVEYEKGHILCNQGEQIVDFMIIQDGEVKVLFKIDNQLQKLETLQPQQEPELEKSESHQLFKTKVIQKTLKDYHIVLKKGFVGLNEILSNQLDHTYTAVAASNISMILVNAQVFLQAISEADTARLQLNPKSLSKSVILNRMRNELVQYEWRNRTVTESAPQKHVDELAYLKETLRKEQQSHMDHQKESVKKQMHQQELFRLKYMRQITKRREYMLPQINCGDSAENLLRQVKLDGKYLAPNQDKQRSLNSRQKQLQRMRKTSFLINDVIQSQQSLHQSQLLQPASQRNTKIKSTLRKKSESPFRRELKFLE